MSSSSSVASFRSSYHSGSTMTWQVEQASEPSQAPSMSISLRWAISSTERPSGASTSRRRAVALDEGHLRHQRSPWPPRRGARSSARIAAPSAGALAAGQIARRDDHATARSPPPRSPAATRRPAPDRAPPRRPARHGSPAGRARARRAAARPRTAPAIRPAAYPGPAPADRAQSPSRSASITALPPTANATSASLPLDVDADRRARRVGIARRAVRLLDLKQLHESAGRGTAVKLPRAVSR